MQNRISLRISLQNSKLNCVPCLEAGENALSTSNMAGRCLQLALRLERNITKEFIDAREGRTVEKVQESKGKTEARLLVVDDSQFLLTWRDPAKSPANSTSTLLSNSGKAKQLELQTVTKIVYGFRTLPYIKDLPQAAPHLCFVLLTEERPYTFICADELAVRSFVLTISRLCEPFRRAVGGISTRRQFEAIKGWCKVRAGCLRKKTSVVRAFRAAWHEIPHAPRHSLGGFLKVEEEKSRICEETEEPDENSLDYFLNAKEEKSPKAKEEKSPVLSRITPEQATARPSEHVTSREKADAPSLDGFLDQNGDRDDKEVDRQRMDMPISPEKPKAAEAQSSFGSHEWPKVGDSWVFTGAKNKVDIFKDSKGEEWVNQLPCTDKNGKHRVVVIISSQTGDPMVEIRGTNDMKFIRGWLSIADDDGARIVMPIEGSEGPTSPGNPQAASSVPAQTSSQSGTQALAQDLAAKAGNAMSNMKSRFGIS
eukprot:TRINITY_DN28720_c0_g1_i1.p1 TRINITY_DN28720_c0_g1~~TRINITY_DN28720_c0_g1_i1.p1  ORF type:complete len:482 (-),score=84.79 TRINITY_DN28720_c0_g1_i1:361-1806(-)